MCGFPYKARTQTWWPPCPVWTFFEGSSLLLVDEVVWTSQTIPRFSEDFFDHIHYRMISGSPLADLDCGWGGLGPEPHRCGFSIFQGGILKQSPSSWLFPGLGFTNLMGCYIRHLRWFGSQDFRKICRSHPDGVCIIAERTGRWKERVALSQSFAT